MKLSVIIVNYNVKYFLEQCLYSVVPAIASLKAEIIVVDNHSSDGSIEYLLPKFPNVIFISNQENLGFGKANNLALKSARGEYILFLNPDTLVPEDCLVKCIDFIDNKPAAGASGIRMLDGNGNFLPESKRSFPTTSAAFYKLAGLSGMFPASKHFNRYSLNYLDEHTNHSVEVLAGAFMLIRKQILDSIGGFDEAFFMYGEDIDLSYRIRQAGFENWYFSGSSIIHFKGESTKKESKRYLNMFYEAMIVFVNKHYKGRNAWLTRSLLKTGIRLRSAAGRFRSRSFTPAAEKIKRQLIIVGSNEDYRECHHIISAQLENEPAIVHLEYPASGNVNDLKQLQFNNATEIVFCTGEQPYSRIIGYIQALGNDYTYRFHARGSNSIVGSDSKHATGETIASH